MLGRVSASLPGLGLHYRNTAHTQGNPVECHMMLSFLTKTENVDEPERDQFSQRLKANIELAQNQSNYANGHCHKFHNKGKGQRK